MKTIIKSIAVFLMFSSSCLSGQNLPRLTLDKQPAEIVLPEITLDEDEICIILTTNLGQTAFDQKIYYTFRKSGEVEGYIEKTPKTYLNNTELKKTGEKLILSSDAQKHLFNCLNSKVTTDFLNYSQSDFTIKTNEGPKITTYVDKHGKTYKIDFIQSNRIKSYYIYQPRQQMRIEDPTINKLVLGKFIKVLELWQMLKT